MHQAIIIHFPQYGDDQREETLSISMYLSAGDLIIFSSALDNLVPLKNIFFGNFFYIINSFIFTKYIRKIILHKSIIIEFIFDLQLN